MSKPSQKKAIRQNRKSKQKKVVAQNWKHTRHDSSATPNFIPPDFPAEQSGVPAAGINWIGQKLGSLLKTRHQ